MQGGHMTVLGYQKKPSQNDLQALIIVALCKQVASFKY